MRTPILLEAAHGELVGDTVFAAHRYERSSDMFDLVGIYAEYDAGKLAAGESASVMQFSIDPAIKNPC